MTNVTTMNRMDLEDPHVGQKFASFQVLRKYLEEYGKKNYVKFWTRSSHTINSLKSKTKRVNPDLKYACMKFACIFGGEKTRCRGSGIRKSTTYRNLGCPCTINAVVGDDGNHVRLETVVLEHNHTLGKSLYDSLKKSKNKSKILETKVNYCDSKTRTGTAGPQFEVGTVPCDTDARSLVQILQSNGQQGTMRTDNAMAARLAANEDFQKCVREMQAKYGPDIKIIVVNREEKKKRRKVTVEIDEHQLAELRREFERKERIRMMRLSKMCRLCLSSNEKLNPIYRTSLPVESTRLSYKIMSCASVDVSRNDNLPGNICTNCEETLEIAYNFRVRCESSDTIVRMPNFATEPLEEDELQQLSSDVEEQELGERNERTDESEDPRTPQYLQEPEEFEDQSEQEAEYTVAPRKTATRPKYFRNISVETANVNRKNTNEENVACAQMEEICPICGNRFRTFRSMLQHLEEHSDIDNFLLSCSFCSSIYSTVKDFVDHLSDHTETLNLPEGANANSLNDNELENMDINVNEIEIENETENDNDDCNNKVSRVVSEAAPRAAKAPRVQEHSAPRTRDKHSDSGYLCSFCGKLLKSKDRFQSHKNTHEGLRPHICMKCGRGFADRKNMHQHYDIVHLRKAKHECPICQKKFYAPTKMKSHITMHYGLKPYSCDICNKTFRLRMNMMKHKKTHSNERPHKCDKCKAAFIDKNLLTRHSYVHGGVRPHVCPGCGHRFTLKFNLKKHIVSGRCISNRADREVEFRWEGVSQFQPGEAPLRVRVRDNEENDEEEEQVQEQEQVPVQVQGNIVEEILQQIEGNP